MMRIAHLLTAPSLAAAVAVTALAQSQPPADEVAAALQRKYDTVRSFTADFTQVYEGGLLKRKATERGKVFIKKPGKMRWNYESPERKEFVSDGRRIYLYLPADKQVMISPVPPEDQATSAVLFLMGKGNLTRDYTVTYAEGGTADTYVLRLDPKIRDAEYDWLLLTVHRESLLIQSLTAGDAQSGRSTFRFSNFKENPNLSDNTFVFTVPPGTEVITSGDRGVR
jgi:outer membrane lipoprotein carrier protein